MLRWPNSWKRCKSARSAWVLKTGVTPALSRADAEGRRRARGSSGASMRLYQVKGMVLSRSARNVSTMSRMCW